MSGMNLKSKIDDARAAIATNGLVRLVARWIFPVCQPPIARGCVEIEHGKFVSVGATNGKPADAHTIDFGNVALLPGLVNTHAHLEFSDLTQPIEPPQPFTRWIGHLMNYRRTRTRSVVELVADGLAECALTGTAVVGEIATSNVITHSDKMRETTSILNVPNNIAAMVAFRECIAPVPEWIDEQLTIAAEHLRSCRQLQTTGFPVIGGLSPHAPYTVLPELFSGLIELAATEHAPLAVHLAETRAELEYLHDGTGEFRGMLERLGLWRDDLHLTGRRPVDWLRQLARLPHALAVHGNYLDPEEIEFLAKNPNVAVVYCPRTHHFFGHTPHPWRELLARGASVAIGTDGRSSNPDYSLWSELRLLDEISSGDMRPTLLELGTIRGARALGIDEWSGELAIGKAATFCLVPLPERGGTDGWSLLFDGMAAVG